MVKRHDKYGRKVANSEMIWKIWKTRKLKCYMIWKIWKKGKSDSSHFNLHLFHIFHSISQFNLLFFRIFTIFSLFNWLVLLYCSYLFNIQLTFLPYFNSEKIWKIWRKASRIVIRYGHYRKKVSRIEKR
jgi:hypothetical protein